MVIILMRMKLAVMRNSLKGEGFVRLSWGVLFGFAAVALTFAWSLADSTSPDTFNDRFMLIFWIWTLGWVFGPILFSGEDKTLLPENFRSLPLTSNQLATGLLGASLLGVPVAISLLAFFSYVVHAWKLGALSAIVAVLAVFFQLVFVILLSKVMTSIMRKLTRSRFSAMLSSLVIGGIMAFFMTGWFLLDVDFGFLNQSFPRQVSIALQLFPSSWGILAVKASGNGQWGLAAVWLIGQVLVIALLRYLWSLLLVNRLTTKAKTNQAAIRRSFGYGPFANQTGAVMLKELLTWNRDFTRSNFVYFALFYSVCLCLYPAIAGNALLLPWAGVIFVIMVTGSTANMYGMDGSALWMSLVTPQALQQDVRGRQLAWLSIMAPAAFLITFVMIIGTGAYASIQWVLPAVIAALGAGAGLVVLNSVFRLDPMMDAHKRGEDLFDNPLGWWQFMSLMIGSLLLVAPVIGVNLLGAYLDSDWLHGTGIPVAFIIGGFCYYCFGRLAYRRLQNRGPELLNLMLHGQHESSQPNAPAQLTKSDFISVTGNMSSRRRGLFYCTLILGLLALFPQGFVPLGIKLTGGTDPVWFLALYLHETWQWPVIALMIGVGVVAFGYAVSLYWIERRKTTQAAVPK